ncbi:MAG: hypothetical protein KTR21_12925 [Rhodobacteraceae bacterium]|nr:hypothetical protein [Paracoccaceae bacterium]
MSPPAFADDGLNHPADVPAAIAQLKRYLSEPRFKIRLHDFVTDEATVAKRAVEALLEQHRDVSPEKVSFGRLLERIENAMRRLVHLYAVASLHADAEQARGSFFRTAPSDGSGNVDIEFLHCLAA